MFSDSHLIQSTSWLRGRDKSNRSDSTTVLKSHKVISLHQAGTVADHKMCKIRTSSIIGSAYGEILLVTGYRF